MEQSTNSDDPIVNCHTHIFTSDHVPPYIARTFVPWPFYYLFNLHKIIGLYKWITNRRNKWLHSQSSLYNRTKRLIERVSRHFLGKLLVIVVKLWLTLNALHIVINWVSKIKAIPDSINKYYEPIVNTLLQFKILFSCRFLILDITIFLVVFLFMKSGRNLILFVLKSIWSFFGKLPGKKTKSLIDRYILMGKFAMYQKQSGIFPKLRHQYPDDTRFITLPMDMEYMNAGSVPTPYPEQMEALAKLKKSKTMGQFLEPFIFIDPRRIVEKEEFLNYTISEGKVELQDCQVKSYLDRGFSGFKIYPALGYYPFDEALLPLWKYAADEGIPIMTHCIEGTIFYRGKKKEAWNKHPVFLESDGKGSTRPLSLPYKKNVDFQVIFTHPLNYLCLVSEPLLRKLVGQAKSDSIRTLFGYTDSETPLKHDLSKLKICLAHFGGEDEWVKYLESDRYAPAQRLIRFRDIGLNFSVEDTSSLNWNILSKIWKSVDWYSIICSLIVQNKNIYTDISYILSKPRILPLLKETLDEDLNPHLSQRVLFGTDFYVVRNHFSEKDMLAQMKAGLSDREFDLIARKNPLTYLKH